MAANSARVIYALGFKVVVISAVYDIHIIHGGYSDIEPITCKYVVERILICQILFSYIILQQTEEDGCHFRTGDIAFWMN